VEQITRPALLRSLTFFSLFLFICAIPVSLLLRAFRERERESCCCLTNCCEITRVQVYFRNTRAFSLAFVSLPFECTRLNSSIRSMRAATPEVIHEKENSSLPRFTVQQQLDFQRATIAETHHSDGTARSQRRCTSN